MKKFRLKIIASFLIVMGVVSFYGGVPVEATSLKEEVVYVRLHNNGFVDQVYVVNSFLLGQEREILDYGNYAAVQNLTGEHLLKLENGQVRISAQGDRLHYEGFLANPQLPWRFHLTYWLDGQKISPAELAGQKGHLRIQIKIADNPRGEREFFESYALQLTLTLKDSLCRNIQTTGGSLVTTGENKQVNFIVLPGKTAILEVSADVWDFAMPALTVAGLRLNLDFDWEEQADLSELQQLMAALVDLDEGVAELLAGIFELGRGLKEWETGAQETAEGAGVLSTGACQLEEGASGLVEGLTKFNHGVTDFSAGCTELETGLIELYSGLEGLQGGAQNLEQGATDLAGGVGAVENSGQALRQGFSAYFDGLLGLAQAQVGLPLTRANYKQVLQDIGPPAAQLLALLQNYEQLLEGLDSYLQGVSQLKGGSGALGDGLTDFQEGLTSYQQGMAQCLDGLTSLAQNSQELVQGGRELKEGAVALEQGLDQFKEGVLELEGGLWQLVEGSGDLAQGMLALEEGMGQLRQGTSQLRSETETLDQDLIRTLQTKFREMLGMDKPVRSFAAKKNGEIASVQFLMQTEGIANSKGESEVLAEEVPLSFWQRLIRLFGF